ncbi:MAG TPA: glycosyltransferase family 4 protein [Anaeromyxobacteraceae bacterium]|nr:glycosyltransferase family 4 protein [Anaeromyxobacteraceae bacterium]
MRVAIYHPWIYVRSGLERTIMELYRRSRHRWTILTSHYDRDGTYPDLKEMGVIELPRVSVRRRYGAVLKAAATIAATRLDLSGQDALVVCCDGLGSLLNFRNHAVPSLCLCFTPLRAVYDSEYRARHLARLGAARPLAHLFEVGFRAIDRRAWQRYSHVFCISETVKRRVLEGGLYPPDGIDIAYAGISGERIRLCDTFEPFFFLPGRIVWTKNLELGIRAFLALRARTGFRFELVIAGMVDEKSRPYLARLEALAGGDPAIRILQDVTDDAMDDLYGRCHAVLFTSFNEDQGLTPLEAAAHGKPVIAVNRGGPTETVRNGETGLLVDATTDAFLEAMERLVRDPELARSLGRRGAERARLFTWANFVESIDGYLDRMEAGRERASLGARSAVGPGARPPREDPAAEA